MRRVLVPLIFGIGGTAILIALGLWQLQRLDWKLGLIDRIETRLAAAPIPVPEAPSEAEHEYRRVRAAGTLLPGELHVYTSVPPHGVGYRVIAPMALADGRRILLDRGFVPIEAKDPARPQGELAVEGSLIWPDESDGFTSDPDREANIWFARDVPLMADALDTEPVMIAVASNDPAGAPLPLPVTVDIRNDHLGYAVTWFGLAATWAGMTLYLLWRMQRRTL